MLAKKRVAERLVDAPIPPNEKLPRAWDELMYAADKSVHKIDAALERLQGACPAGLLESGVISLVCRGVCVA